LEVADLSEMVKQSFLVLIFDQGASNLLNNFISRWAKKSRLSAGITPVQL